MDGFRIQTIGHPGHHQAAAAVIEHPDHIAVLDALLLRHLVVDMAHQIGVAVDDHAVLGDLPQPLGVLLIMGMIVKPRMGRNQAIGILIRRQALKALPGILILGNGTARFVVGCPVGQGLGYKLELAGEGAQLALLLEDLMVHGVAGTVLCKPLETGIAIPVLVQAGLGVLILLMVGHGRDVVALLLKVLPRDMLGQIGELPEAFCPLLFGAALGKALAPAKPCSHLRENPEVGTGIPHGLNGLILVDDDLPGVTGLRMGAVTAVARVTDLADIHTLQVCAGRENHVGMPGLRGHVDILVDDELQLGALIHLGPLVGVQHGAEEGTAVTPEAVNLIIAGRRIDMAGKLLIHAAATEAFAIPLIVSVQNRVGHIGAIEHLLYRVHGYIIADGCACNGGKGIGIAAEPEVIVHGAAAGRAPEGTAGLAHALHCKQQGHQTGVLGAVGMTAGAAETAAHAGTAGGDGVCPTAGNGLDIHGGNQAQLRCPTGGLRCAVRAQAKNMVLELLKPVAVLGHIFLIISTLGNPHIGNGLQQCSIGAHPGADPLVGVLDRSIVVKGIDVDELNAHLLHPPAPQCRLLCGVTAAAGIGVGGPADDGFGILHGHLQHIIGLGAAQTPVVTVGMRGAPVEALPGVRVIGNAGIAHHGEEALKQRNLIANQAPGMVGRGTCRDGFLAIGLLEALDLPGHQAQSLVPGSAAITGLTAVFGVAVLAVGCLHKVLADHGVFQTVISIGFIPLAVAKQAHGGLSLGGIFLAPGLNNPACGIVVGQNDGANTTNHAVDGVKGHRAAHAYAVGNTLLFRVGTHGYFLHNLQSSLLHFNHLTGIVALGVNFHHSAYILAVLALKAAHIKILNDRNPEHTSVRSLIMLACMELMQQHFHRSAGCVCPLLRGGIVEVQEGGIDDTILLHPHGADVLPVLGHGAHRLHNHIIYIGAGHTAALKALIPDPIGIHMLAGMILEDLLHLGYQLVLLHGNDTLGQSEHIFFYKIHGTASSYRITLWAIS